MMLREDPDVNQLTESVDLLGSLWKNRFLRRLSFILFLNKNDQLEEKIAKHGTASLEKHHPDFKDYEPSSDKLSQLELVQEYLLHQFLVCFHFCAFSL